jgi:hypothetical protein
VQHGVFLDHVDLGLVEGDVAQLAAVAAFGYLH